MPPPSDKQPAQSPPSSPATAAAVTAGGQAALGAGTVAIPAAGAAGAVVIAAPAAGLVAKVVGSVIAGLAKWALLRQAGDAWLSSTLRKQYPDRPDHEIEQAALQEVAFEKEFLRRMRKRLERDLPEAFAEPNPQTREKRVQAILRREQHYIRLREEAKLNRAVNTVERSILREYSPDGAYWWLSPDVKEHTPDCVAFAGRFWPWEVLNLVHPPVHHGCACRLFGKDEAISAGWLTRDNIPLVNDAVVNANEIIKQYGLLQEANVSNAELELYLQEAVRHNLRWQAGLVTGGQFRPLRGGVPGLRSAARRALNAFLSDSSAVRPLAGRFVKIDERSEWVPQRGEKVFPSVDGDLVSPQGGTNLYRDGELVSTPRSPKVSPPQTVVLEQTIDDVRRELRRAPLASAAASVRKLDSSRSPIRDGAGPEAFFALEDAGFVPTMSAPSVLGGTEHYWKHIPTGSTLKFNTDDRMRVHDVRWEAGERTSVAANSLSNVPPVTFDEFAESNVVWAHQIGDTYNDGAEISSFDEDFAFADTAGMRDWDGVVHIGPDARSAVETAAQARAEGVPLTNYQKEQVYRAYQCSVHELVHCSSLPSYAEWPDSKNPTMEQNAVLNLEEALTEEIAHVLAADRLSMEGQTDILAFIRDNPQAATAQGVYQEHRTRLGNILDEAQVPPEQREGFLLFLKFKNRSADDRFGILGDALQRSGAAETLVAGRALAIEMMTADEHKPSPDSWQAILSPNYGSSTAGRYADLNGTPIRPGDTVSIDEPDFPTGVVVRVGMSDYANEPTVLLQMPDGSFRYPTISQVEVDTEGPAPQGARPGMSVTWVNLNGTEGNGWVDSVDNGNERAWRLGVRTKDDGHLVITAKNVERITVDRAPPQTPGSAPADPLAANQPTQPTTTAWGEPRWTEPLAGYAGVLYAVNDTDSGILVREDVAAKKLDSEALATGTKIDGWWNFPETNGTGSMSVAEVALGIASPEVAALADQHFDYFGPDAGGPIIARIEAFVRNGTSLENSEALRNIRQVIDTESDIIADVLVERDPSRTGYRAGWIVGGTVKASTPEEVAQAIHAQRSVGNFYDGKKAPQSPGAGDTQRQVSGFEGRGGVPRFSPVESGALVPEAPGFGVGDGAAMSWGVGDREFSVVGSEVRDGVTWVLVANSADSGLEWRVSSGPGPDLDSARLRALVKETVGSPGLDAFSSAELALEGAAGEPGVLDRLRDGDGPVEEALRSAFNALGVDPYDVDLGALDLHSDVHEAAPQSRLKIAGANVSPCSHLRDVDFAVHVLLPEMLREKFPVLAEKLRRTSPRWGWRSGNMPVSPAPQSPGATVGKSAPQSPGTTPGSSVVPNYDATPLTLGSAAGGSNGARWAFDDTGRRWLIKAYRGDQDRVATELLANRVYAALGVPVADAGTRRMTLEPRVGAQPDLPDQLSPKPYNQPPELELAFAGPDSAGKQTVTALAYPTVEGDTQRILKPSVELGKGFMADALVANWDFVGLTDDNVLWTPEGQPVRIDQGSTFERRAMGTPKPFGPVPSEVWTMMGPRGQAFGKVRVTEPEMRAQAADIAEKLTPGTIDNLMDGVPFRDVAMRERVRENLKARVEWMSAFAAGEEGLPEPLVGDEARDALDANQNFEVFPMEDIDVRWFAANRPEVTAHLRSGAAKKQASRLVQSAIRSLDALIMAAEPLDDDLVVFAGLSGVTDPAGLLDRTFGDKAFGIMTLSEEAARKFRVVSRVTVPAGSRAVRLAGLDGLGDLPDKDLVVLSRRAKYRAVGITEVDGKPYVDVVALPTWKQAPQTTGFAGPEVGSRAWLDSVRGTPALVDDTVLNMEGVLDMLMPPVPADNVFEGWDAVPEGWNVLADLKREAAAAEADLAV